MDSNARQSEIASRHGYPTPAQVSRLIRAVRGEGINPSSFKFGADGSILISAHANENEPRSTFDVWNEAGKL